MNAIFLNPPKLVTNWQNLWRDT